MPAERTWKTTVELARMMGVHPATVSIWGSTGRIKTERPVGKKMRVPADEVQRLQRLFKGRVHLRKILRTEFPEVDSPALHGILRRYLKIETVRDPGNSHLVKETDAARILEWLRYRKLFLESTVSIKDLAAQTGLRYITAWSLVSRVGVPSYFFAGRELRIPVVFANALKNALPQFSTRVQGKKIRQAIQHAFGDFEQNYRRTVEESYSKLAFSRTKKAAVASSKQLHPELASDELKDYVDSIGDPREKKVFVKHANQLFSAYGTGMEAQKRVLGYVQVLERHFGDRPSAARGLFKVLRGASEMQAATILSFFNNPHTRQSLQEVLQEHGGETVEATSLIDQVRKGVRKRMD